MEATQTEQKRVPTSAKSFMQVKSFAEKYPDWKESSLRWLIFNRETNGLKSVFRKVGKRVLIDEAAFFAKIDESAM